MQGFDVSFIVSLNKLLYKRPGDFRRQNKTVFKSLWGTET